jgi:hypothetical protein
MRKTAVLLGAFLPVALSLAACAGMEPFEGMALDRARRSVFASSTAPGLVVAPADGFAPVSDGRLFVEVSRNGIFSAYSSVRVGYALFAEGSRQLAVCLASVSGGQEWPPNPDFTERRGLAAWEISMTYHDGFEMETVTYVRQGSKDPWMSAYAASGSGWEGDLLVRQYSWRTSSGLKLVVEYREAAPAEEGGPRENRADFAERADASFLLSRGAETRPVPSARSAATVDRRLLAAVLGEVRPKFSVWELDH